MSSRATLGKLQWLLRKAVAAFGDVPVSQLRPARDRGVAMTISAAHRLEATQALRQVSPARSTGDSSTRT
jgi:hypothetical protein